jgi:hypothetical protein
MPTKREPAAMTDHAAAPTPSEEATGTPTTRAGVPAMAEEGPVQVWNWSRVDGTIRQFRVRPSDLRVEWIGMPWTARTERVWIEDCPDGGWGRYPDRGWLYFSRRAAVAAARAHFEGKAERAHAALRALPPEEGTP